MYIPSYKRAECTKTAALFKKHKVPFFLVVDENDREDYCRAGYEEHLLLLPFLNNGTSYPPRNFIWEHSVSEGAKRHWQVDDNIFHFKRFTGKERQYIPPGVALRMIEEFSDQYTNIAIFGPNYSTFCMPYQSTPPVRFNCHIYSCMCIKNDLPFRWRGPWNEDVDLCLQSLVEGYCTIATQFVCQQKAATMTTKGGNTVSYSNLDSRAYGSRTLQAKWPGLVELTNKYGRPHFHIKKNWAMFRSNKLIKDPNYTPMKFSVKDTLS